MKINGPKPPPFTSNIQLLKGGSVSGNLHVMYFKSFEETERSRTVNQPSWYFLVLSLKWKHQNNM